MSEQSRVFIGLLRPPKLMGLPIMYAMVWLFGSTLLFLWVQSGVVAVFARRWPGPPSGKPRTGIRTSLMSW